MTRFMHWKQLMSLPAFGRMVLSTALLGLTVSFTRPYIPLYATHVLKMSPLKLGIFMAITSLGSVGLSSHLGRLSDTRYPRKTVLLVSTGSAIAGYACYLTLRSYFLLLVTSGIFFGLAGAIFPQLFAYARDCVTDRPESTATAYIAVLRSIFSLAWVVGPLLGAWLLADVGFRGLLRATMMAYGCLALIVLAFFQSHVVRHPPSFGKTPGQEMPARSAHQMRMAAVAFTCFFLTNTMYSIAMPLFVEQVLRGTNRDVGILFAVSALAEVPIMLALTKISRYLGKTVILTIGAGLAALYYAVVAMSQALWSVFLFQYLDAAAVAAFMSLGMSWFQELSSGAAGRMTTRYANTTYLGSVGGSLLVGIVSEYGGLRSVYWVAMALAILATAFLFGVARQTGATVTGYAKPFD
jgi:SET family sugar efflux transporter-like MFS transporter